MALKTKLLVSMLLLSVAPVALVAGIAIRQTERGFTRATKTTESILATTTQFSKEALLGAGSTDLTHVAQNVYAMCQAQQELLQQKVNCDLNVARAVLQQLGSVSFGQETVSWTAINQCTKAQTQVALPKMLVGTTWLGQISETAAASPVVDQVKGLVGGTCTVFQKMNAAGDMLRVCTNVETAEGARAIGTFVPAVNPDGSPNPVVSTVLRGEPYHGRAYVVNAWYITAYEPIKDAAGEVVGVLYVGVKEESTDALRKAIMSVSVGKTGYVYVLNAQGDTRGRYVISKDGKRDGENLWEAKDADGRLFIQDACKTALALKAGEIGEIRYPWKNPEDPAPRNKVVKLAYFAPWDWLVGVGAYEDDFFGVVNTLNEKGKEGLSTIRGAQAREAKLVITWFTGIGVSAFLVATAVAIFVTRGITRPMNRIIAGLNEGADQVNDAAGQVSAASQQLAEGANEQASSLEETSSALEQMAAMTRTNAANAKEANGLASQARKAADDGDQTMHQLNRAMTGINESSDKISKIIKVIEEIAFQTNLLALNAAVEAARAGEHGKGFAVVADEVRNLAQRAAQAARETTGLIEDSVNRAREGTQVAGEVGKALGVIAGDVSKVTELVNGIAQASQEQAQGVDQVNTAVSQMNKVTQQNASGAEESASASEELAAQAQAVKGMINELVVLIGAKAAQRGSAASNTTTATAKADKKLNTESAHTHKERHHKPQAKAAAASRGKGKHSEEFLSVDDSGDLREF